MEEHWIPVTPLRHCMQFCPDCLLCLPYRLGTVAHGTPSVQLWKSHCPSWADLTVWLL